MQWKCGDENGIWKLPECAPGKVIKVLLSLENAEDQSPVTLEFLDGNDCQIDEMKVFSRDYVEAPLFELSADETENIKALKIHKENQDCCKQYPERVDNHRSVHGYSPIAIK